MDTKFNANEKTEIRKNSICVFEYAADYPLQRHTGESFVSIARNTYFVVKGLSGSFKPPLLFLVESVEEILGE